MNCNPTTIGKHCTVTSSKRFHLSDRSEKGVPFYCSKEIIQKVNGETVTECDYIKEEAYEAIKERFGVPQPGDLLITTRGTYGVPYLYKPSDRFYFADGNLTWLKDFDDQLYAPYLYYWVLSFEGQKKIDAIAKGTAQKAVPISLIKEIQLCLPSLEKQKQIVSILNAFDQLIENSRKQIKLLEEAAQRLYKEWFVDLRFPGYEDTPIIDGVPEGWCISNIVSLCSRINAGGTPSRSKKNYWNNPTIKWFKTGELQDCWLIDSDEMISQEGLDGSSAKIFPKNTILMAIYASPTLGRLGILTSDAACNQAALCLLADESKVSWQWLYGKLYELREDFNVVAKGAGQQNISADTVKKKEVMVPSKGLMDDFSKLVAPMYDKRLLLQKQINNLSQARDRLLLKLMSGEIEV